MGRKIDLTGQRFGKWTVLSECEDRSSGGIKWLCHCDCGTEKEVIGESLRRGSSKSCGCGVLVNLIGEKYGRLTVIEEIKDRTVHGAKVWRCKCDCGGIKDVLHGSLTCGRTSSCGCVFVEIMELRRGKNHPMYNPELTDKDRLTYRYDFEGNNSKAWRSEIFAHDDFICQSCNKRGYKLNAHHLNAWNAFPEQRFDTANGITLCKDCHKEFHRFNGYGDNTLEQFRDHIACTVGEEYVSEIEEVLLSRESEIIGQEKQTRELQTT